MKKFNEFINEDLREDLYDHFRLDIGDRLINQYQESGRPKDKDIILRDMFNIADELNPRISVKLVDDEEFVKDVLRYVYMNTGVKESVNEELEEGPEISNRKFVTSPKPNIVPAPQSRPSKQTYKIYTSQDGIIEFDESILEPYDDEDDVFFLNMEWREKFDTFRSTMDVKFDKDKMFVFFETHNGDIGEYKVFIG